MEIIVVHSTQYGSTEKYATQIAQKIQCPVVKSTMVDVDDLKDYDLIIIGSCLLEGKLAHAKVYEQWIHRYPDKHWIYFTVGLSNPALTDFQSLLLSHFQAETLTHMKTFHYRGTIQYKRLLLMSSLMNEAQRKKIHSIDQVKLSEDNKQLLHKYGTHYDLSDANRIQGLVQFVQEIINTKE